jgi:hypothetical protein
MQTSVMLENSLIERAKTLTGLKTKREVVEESLRLLIRLYEQEEVRSLRGKLHWEEHSSVEGLLKGTMEK